MKINPTTLTRQDIEIIVGILSRGNTCEVKRERDNVVIVEIERHAKIKKPILD